MDAPWKGKHVDFGKKGERKGQAGSSGPVAASPRYPRAGRRGSIWPGPGTGRPGGVIISGRPRREGACTLCHDNWMGNVGGSTIRLGV